MRNRVVFFGTPEIGCAVLQTLLNNKALEVVGVVCQPDRPANHHKIYFSPVKQLAITQHLNLFQPEKLKQIEEQLKDLQPDLIVTCAYGLIVPESILKIPKYKCVNIHPSLLPKYRGPAPINYAIFNKDKITGVTLMYMDKGMDSGDIIAQSPPVLIAVDETYSTLYKKLTNVACVLLNEHIEGLFSTDVKSTKQDPNNITFSHMITKEIMQINWNDDADNIVAKINGLYAKPLAFCVYNGINIKIHQAKEIKLNREITDVGVIIEVSSSGIVVTTKTNFILLEKIQLPSKNPVSVKDLVNGNHIFKVNTKFN